MYNHTVQYYETDKMGITHHSNYIRWMEEARVDYMDKIGYSYERLEEEGIISPVLSVDCNYRKSTKFPEVVSIDVLVEEFKGVRLKLAYTMKNAAGDVVCDGHTSHGFLNAEGRPIRLKTCCPELCDKLLQLMDENVR